MHILASFLTLCAVLWIVSILPSEYVRLKYQTLISDIKHPEKNITLSDVEAAIEDYQRMASYNFCHGNFYRDLTSLYNAKYAHHTAHNNFDEIDATLNIILETLEKHLQCQPKDGNGWFTKAVTHIQHGGFNSDALQAYKQAALVAPREAWLAEKRTLFAIHFFPIFDEEAQDIALQDIEVLTKASTNRRRKIRTMLNIDSLDSLLEQMKQAQNSDTP